MFKRLNNNEDALREYLKSQYRNRQHVSRKFKEILDYVFEAEAMDGSKEVNNEEIAKDFNIRLVNEVKRACA